MIQVIDLEKKPEHLQEMGMEKEDFINSSSIIGGSIPIIILGFYDNIEKKRISFFHELGHILKLNEIIFDDEFFNKEKEAWDIGCKLANTLGIEFSEECKEWAKEQLDTYKENKQCIKY